MGNRIGKFIIDAKMVEDTPAAIRLLMGKLIVIRCEHCYYDGCFHYMALCDEFEEVPRGNMIPKYDVIGSIEDGEVNFLFNKGK